jgi:flagellar biosynthesis protein FlhG
MTETVFDQAAGLRRMLAPPALRNVAVTGPSAVSGYAGIAANLALALAAQGRDVVVVDAEGEEGGPGGLFGGERGRDLMDGVRNACPLEQIVVQARPRLRLVRAQRFFAGFDQLQPTDAGNLAEAMAAVCRDADVLLIAADPGNRAALATADALLLVTLDDADSLTRTYRVLKRAAADGRQQRAAVLLNRTRSQARSDRIFGNLASTSARFLSLPLECMGNIPEDAHLERAAQLRQPVIELFPASAAAAAMRASAEAFMRLPCPEHATAHAFAARVISTVRSAARGRH